MKRKALRRTEKPLKVIERDIDELADNAVIAELVREAKLHCSPTRIRQDKR